MEIQTGALVIVLAYMVGMMIIGYVVGKINIKGSADYLVAGRRMGLFMVAFSLSANNIGGGSTTGLAQKAFGAWGVSAIWNGCMGPMVRRRCSLSIIGTSLRR